MTKYCKRSDCCCSYIQTVHNRRPWQQRAFGKVGRWFPLGCWRWGWDFDAVPRNLQWSCDWHQDSIAFTEFHDMKNKCRSRVFSVPFFWNQMHYQVSCVSKSIRVIKTKHIFWEQGTPRNSRTCSTRLSFNVQKTGQTSQMSLKNIGTLVIQPQSTIKNRSVTPSVTSGYRQQWEECQYWIHSEIRTPVI